MSKNEEESVRLNDLGADFEVCTIEKKKKKWSDLKKDWKKIAFLIFLYILQSVPIGLVVSIPYLLGTRKVSYADQGTFSFAAWPYSMKLLWAPLVDSVYFKKFGRRKTWLIPVQLLISVFMFLFAKTARDILDNTITEISVIYLLLMFGTFILLAATQDIALDGLAISILSKENVGWQSTCNGVGFTIGFFISHTAFNVLESTNFSNKYIRPFFGLEAKNRGIVTIDIFMYVFGALYFLATLIILFFNENKHTHNHDKVNVKSSYKQLWKILKIPSMKILIPVILTSQIGFAVEGVIFLKLIENDVSKEKISLLLIPLFPISLLWPFVISKFSSGPKPYITMHKIYPLRLAMVILLSVFVYFTPKFKNENNDYGYVYFIICWAVFSVKLIGDNSTSMCQLGFFARISDEKYGGTYMAFLTTIGNLGLNTWKKSAGKRKEKYSANSFSSTLAMFLLNLFTFKYCSHQSVYDPRNLIYIKNSTTFNNQSSISFSATFNATLNDNNQTDTNLTSLILSNTCSTTTKAKNCADLNGKCVTSFDAFYALTTGFLCFGVLWHFFLKKTIYKLNNLPLSHWKLK